DVGIEARHLSAKPSRVREHRNDRAGGRCAKPQPAGNRLTAGPFAKARDFGRKTQRTGGNSKDSGAIEQWPGRRSNDVECPAWPRLTNGRTDLEQGGLRSPEFAARVEEDD